MPGIVQKKGSHYSYGELRIGQGRDTALDFLREHEVLAELTEAVRKDSAKLQAALPSGNRAGEEIEVVEIS